jgi:hypothetical protein
MNFGATACCLRWYAQTGLSGGLHSTMFITASQADFYFGRLWRIAFFCLRDAAAVRSACAQLARIGGRLGTDPEMPVNCQTGFCQSICLPKALL